MEIDPMESATAASEKTRASEAADSRLGSWVAITVALLATFLGVCKVKDDNLVQSMQQAQADKLDHWSFYQARNLREEVAKATLVQLNLSEATAQDPQVRAKYRDAITNYERLVAEQAAKKEELRLQAEADQSHYDTLNYHDDQFDLADALIALAISLLALTALTHKKWLYWIALIPTMLGTIMGSAGLFGWHLHSEFFARLLS